jgi:hypothetical protein
MTHDVCAKYYFDIGYLSSFDSISSAPRHVAGKEFPATARLADSRYAIDARLY